MNIAQSRLQNQRLIHTGFHRPAEVVDWLGAVQAQDYPMSKWAIGLRLPECHETDIEQAVIDRSIVRTWALRGTLHILPPADIRWLLALIAPSIIPRYGPYYRKLELDEATLARSKEVLAKAMQGNEPLTRKEVTEALEGQGISTQGLRLNFILYRAALDRLTCHGPLRGKQQTFTLLDEWLPPSPDKPHEEALGELARRYFTSHGPATLKDFAWWSGLPAADARSGLELVKSHFIEETVDGQAYWLPANKASATPAAVEEPSPHVLLLPDYDEYLVGYADRTAAMDPAKVKALSSFDSVFNPCMIVDGQVVGLWKRTFKKGTVELTFHLMTPLGDEEAQGIQQAAYRFGDFLGLPVVM